MAGGDCVKLAMGAAYVAGCSAKHSVSGPWLQLCVGERADAAGAGAAGRVVNDAGAMEEVSKRGVAYVIDTIRGGAAYGIEAPAGGEAYGGVAGAE